MTNENPYRLGIDQIRKFLPHRAPFLMVDRVLEIHPPMADGSSGGFSAENMVGVRVVALKNISFNEPQFQGHFPTFSIMPGVLMIEAMAQVASFSVYPLIEKDLENFAKEFQCILVGVDSVRFRKPVVPGDQVQIETVVKKVRGRIWQFGGICTVDGQKVAEAEILANLAGGSFK